MNLILLSLSLEGARCGPDKCININHSLIYCIKLNQPFLDFSIRVAFPGHFPF